MKKLMTAMLGLSFLGATAMFAQVPAPPADKKTDTAKKVTKAKKTAEKKEVAKKEPAAKKEPVAKKTTSKKAKKEAAPAPK